MDLLQIVLVFFILLLAVFLSILGVQVFYILRELKRSLDKIDRLLGDAHQVASGVAVPVAKAAGEKVAAAIKNRVGRPTKNLFKTNSK
ncbi:MAG: hypothetical protein V1808_04160 [Candidatus Daviesbacteria bacterium]